MPITRNLLDETCPECQKPMTSKECIYQKVIQVIAAPAGLQVAYWDDEKKTCCLSPVDLLGVVELRSSVIYTHKDYQAKGCWSIREESDGSRKNTKDNLDWVCGTAVVPLQLTEYDEWMLCNECCNYLGQYRQEFGNPDDVFAEAIRRQSR